MGGVDTRSYDLDSILAVNPSREVPNLSLVPLKRAIENIEGCVKYCKPERDHFRIGISGHDKVSVVRFGAMLPPIEKGTLIRAHTLCALVWASWPKGMCMPLPVKESVQAYRLDILKPFLYFWNAAVEYYVDREYAASLGLKQ